MISLSPHARAISDHPEHAPPTPPIAAISFLRALFERADRAIVQVVFDEPSRRRVELYDLNRPNLEHDLPVWFEANRRAAGSGLYLGVHPRATPGMRGEDVERFCSLLTDVDSKRTEEWSALSKRLQELREGGINPSALINSGRGRHAYWFLEEPEPAHGKPSTARAVMYRLQKFMGSDMVHDLPRILRMPGSINWKDGQPIQSTILEFEPGRRFTSIEIERGLDRVGAPRPELPRSIRPRRVNAGVRHTRARAPRASPPAIQPPKYRPTLPVLSDRIQRLIVNGHAHGDGYPSRSEAIQAVVLALVRTGCSPERIERILMAYPIGEKLRELGTQAGRYLDECIASAEDYLTPGCERLTVTIDRTWVNEYPASEGRPPVTQLRLLLRVHGGERDGTESYVGLYVPDELHTESCLRWRALRVTPLVGPLRGFVKLRSCGSDVYATDGRVSMSS